MEPTEPTEPTEPSPDLDPRTIGLVVFYVSLIVIVAALLILPAVL